MRPRAKVRLRDGTIVELKSGEYLPDGATLITTMLLMDGDRRTSAGDDRVETHRKMVADLQDAWRGAGGADGDAGQRERRDKMTITGDEARAKMVADLSNAWRGDDDIYLQEPPR